MTGKTAKTQGYCDRMRGQHLNPFAFDLQPQEFLFTSVWHRKFRSVIGMPRLEVAMLLWVVDEELTHLRTWRI